MTDQEISHLVSSILRDYVPDAGFKGAEATSDVDFQGDPVIRVVAHYDRRPTHTPDLLLDSVHVLRSALMEKGEERFILLKNDVAAEQQNDGDID